jgi:hypothetical protein
MGESPTRLGGPNGGMSGGPAERRNEVRAGMEAD